MFIDSHAHLEQKNFDGDREACIARASDAGVRAFFEICDGSDRDGAIARGVDLLEAHPRVYGAVGLHPHDASLFSDAAEQKMREAAKHPKIRAWGEIGLDYYYDNSPREQQRQAFARQLEVAKGLGFPVVIHTRDAEDDTLAILREVTGGQPAGVLHCFTGTYRLASAAIEMGLMVSFSGILTFKKAVELRDVAAKLPLERLLIETDCPFLAPEPHRGKRNEPAFVVEVARQLGEIHKKPAEEVGEITARNFCSLFGVDLGV